MWSSMSLVQRTPLLVVVRLFDFIIALQVFDDMLSTTFSSVAHPMACIPYNFVENHLYASL